MNWGSSGLNPNIYMWIYMIPKAAEVIVATAAAMASVGSYIKRMSKEKKRREL